MTEYQDLARQAAQKLQGDEFNALVREVLLEFLRSPEGRELIAEIRARRQEHQQEAAQHED